MKFPFPFPNTPLKRPYDESSQLHSNEETDKGVTRLVKKNYDRAYQRKLQRPADETWS